MKSQKNSPGGFSVGDVNDEIIIRKMVDTLKSKYEFKGPLHFTDFINLKNILRSGFLYSRYHCEKNGISFTDGANHSVLNKANELVHKCVRFYYRGKSPTLYENEGIKLTQYCSSIHIPIPVFLLFDEQLLYLEYTFYANGNATNSELGYKGDFFVNMDWNAIFSHTSFSYYERNHIINKRQAELLSLYPVPLTYLKKITFRCETDRKRALYLFGNDDRYMVDISLFSDKNIHPTKHENEENNFIKDYRLELLNDEEISLSLYFQKSFKNYLTSIKILDINKRKCGIKINANKDDDLHFIKSYNLKGNIYRWNKLEVYLNSFLCVEDSMLEIRNEREKRISEREARIKLLEIRNREIVDAQEKWEKDKILPHSSYIEEVLKKELTTSQREFFDLWKNKKIAFYQIPKSIITLEFCIIAYMKNKCIYDFILDNDLKYQLDKYRYCL